MTSPPRPSCSATTQTRAPMLYISMALLRTLLSSSMPSHCTTRSPRRRRRRQPPVFSAGCLARLAHTLVARLPINAFAVYT
jgi:hypothetical protein